jgi:hypothetical protein
MSADQGTSHIPAGIKDNALFEQAASVEPYAKNSVNEVVFKL